MSYKTYIGTKVLKAKPMTRREYNDLRGWTLPEGENGADEGFVTDNCHGHIQWQPKDVFLDSFAPMTGMDFGLAVAAMKQGMRVARKGWNGKGMWLAMSPGRKDLPSDKFWAGPNRAYAEANGGAADVLPCITMKTAPGEILMGWLASQTDILAEDWEIVHEI